MDFWSMFVLLSLAYVLPIHVSGKECTNIPTQISSHTVRYQLMTTNNATWKAEMLSHYHVTPTDDSAWMDLLPRKLLGNDASYEELDWAMFYRLLKSPDGYGAVGGNFLKEVSLHDVRLDPDSRHGQAQQANLDYLLMLDVDSLVWSFRKEAGLPTPGTPYGGWEAPDIELRGHFVGHYMSASAKLWASTHNSTLNEKMSAVVDVLRSCQNKIGTGYLSAFPPEFFDRFEAIQSVWAPYYTIHKIMAGLLDQYTFAGNAQALKMVIWMAEYFGNRVINVISKYTIERHWTSLNEETGGMNDVLYNLYSITGDQKHLTLAHLFDKPCFLGLLAVQADSLSGFHTNTHIPVVVGAQRRYEVTGDPLYRAMGTLFMDFVNSSHSYATGGTSVSEFWSDPKHLADTLTTENEESCTTYNMLKVSRHLFRWTKEMAYADYYERALTNGVLSIQRGREPGIMIYMLPQGRGVSKARSYHGWGTRNDSFWCCYGTGIESFSKLGDSIYFEEDGNTPGIYIIQFISSSLDWKSGGIVLTQKVAYTASSDPYLRVNLTVSSNKSLSRASTLNLRIPFWTSLSGAKATLNAQDLDMPSPGNFLSVTKNWTPDDGLTLQLPIGLRTEAIEDDRPEYSSLQAILFGPYLLVGLTASGDSDIITRNASSISDWIIPTPPTYSSQLVSLTQESGNANFVFTKSNQIITMEALPGLGTDSAINATFRVVMTDPTDTHLLSGQNIIGRSVMLEPFDLPGMVVVHQGDKNSLTVSAANGSNSVFKVVSGLDENANTISLEAASLGGCFVYSGIGYKPGRQLHLVCQGNTKDATFHQATSFKFGEGMRDYNPISFIAKGANRNFLLEPLMDLMDESYTVYFNISG